MVPTRKMNTGNYKDRQKMINEDVRRSFREADVETDHVLIIVKVNII